jgi:hypothetical protein
LYLNKAAWTFLGKTSNRADRYNAKCFTSYREGTRYGDISPEAVENGLWVYQYGFNRSRRCIDGAYYREIILSELTHADRIYVVRPIASTWKSANGLPRNWPELQDLETEIGFNGSYVGERDKILLVNKLIDDHVLDTVTGPAGVRKYHKIDMVQIEPRKPRGFFEYVFEDMDLFDDGYEQATKQFEAEG